jgi:hypothetical protein
MIHGNRQLLVLIVVLALALLSGCHPLAPGALDAIQPISNTSRKGNVYLIRGWRDLYSVGIDQLADELRQRGVRAQVYQDEQWRELSATIADRYHVASGIEPLVLIGFSYGADDVVRTSQQLGRRGMSPDLLITIDPVTPPPVPANVRVCYNFFQTNGVWDVFPWLRGVALNSAGAGMVVNVDIRRDRPDLLETNTTHSNIAANPKLHRAIIERVLGVCTPRDDRK